MNIPIYSPLKVTFFTGLSCQAGSSSAELLLENGCEIFGVKRRASSFNTSRIDHTYLDSHIDNVPALNVGDVVVKIDSPHFCPAEVETLLGDPAMAKGKFGWTLDITARGVCEEMMASDLGDAKRYALFKTNGYSINLSAK